MSEVRGQTSEVGGQSGLKEVPASDEEWRRKLSPEAYAVLRQAGTERAFTGAYTDTEDPGLYRCGACGNPLFESDTKYHSGCGWPSFTETVSPEAVELLEDRAHGMVRTEVRCARCGSHLGHVFPDGPQDRGGLRYCMNSVALELDGCGPSRLAGRPAGQAGRGCQPSDRQLGFNRGDFWGQSMLISCLVFDWFGRPFVMTD